MLNSHDQNRNSFGFCIESDSSEGRRCLIDWRRGIVNSGMRSSRIFHRSQYCTSTEMAGCIGPSFEEPVQSKWIVSGTLSAREIQRFAIFSEGRSRVTVIDDHSASVDNATCRQPVQTRPTSKGERSGLKLDIPSFGMQRMNILANISLGSRRMKASKESCSMMN
jgi:hypothetical protein